MKKALVILILSLVVTIFMTPNPSVEARKLAQFDDPVKQGEYIAHIAGCISCHTPLNLETFESIEDQLFAGGLPFDLGPLGVVFAKNLTPDPETGLGNWTDTEIKMAIRTGVSKDGLHLFPVMPYVIYNNMAESDLDALVAYLRSLPPIRNELPRDQILSPEELPQLTAKEGIVAPDPADTAARADYLFSGVFPCTECHTPLDQNTGQPRLSHYLAGGQPFEGVWGIIYGSNITPHQETGIGNWSDEDVQRVLAAGIRPDGRRVVLMPWEDFQPLTSEDMAATIYYLRHQVTAVDHEVPAPALNDAFVEFVEIPARSMAAVDNTTPLILIVVALGLVIATRVYLYRAGD